MAKLALILLLAFLPLQSAQAQFFIGPSASSMGNAGIAGADSGESSFLNPAALSFIQRYYMSGFYGIGKHQNTGDMTQWGVMLADGTSEALFPGSLSYVRRKTDFANGYTDTQHDAQFSFAGMPYKTFSLGFTIHRQVDQIFNAAQIGSEYTQYNGHVGALWVPSPSFGFGAVAYEVAPSSESVPQPLKPMPTLGIGAHYLYENIFRARLDIVRPEIQPYENRRLNVGLGFESYFRGDFALRLGHQWRETANESVFTAGLAYHGPRLSLDYGFQKDLRVAEGYRHMFDLWIPF